MNANTQLILALSFAAGGCAIETDLDVVAQEAAGAPVLLAQSGTGQDREVMSTFDPLVVTLTDTGGNPLADATITFTSPLAGASATFRFGGQVTTDASGRAELRPYANSIAGTYTVWAHADGAMAMPFVLTNMAGAPAQLVTVLGTNQARKVGAAFPYPLTIEVRDNWGNLVEGAPVQFVAPTSGPTTRMAGDGSTVTDDEGRAAVFATAGDMVGSYSVVAKVAGAPSVTFSLSNLASEPLLTHTRATLSTFSSNALVRQ
jgi:hypothetical protein